MREDLVTLATLLQFAAERFPERVALSGENGVWTYAAFVDEVARLAAGFRQLGLAPGDRLATLLSPRAEMVKTLLAAAWAELILVPISSWYAEPQVEYILRHSSARALVSESQLVGRISTATRTNLEMLVTVERGDVPSTCLADLIQEAPIKPVQATADPVGLIIYTSGTTSRPKGVAHTQQRLAKRVDRFVREMKLGPSDSTLVMFDLSRPTVLFGQLLPMLHAGGTAHLAWRRSGTPDHAHLWSRYAEAKPSYMVSLPPLAMEMFGRDEARRIDHRGLRYWIVGGDKAPAALHTRAAEVIGRPLLEMCGLTETGYFAIHPPTAVARPGSVGPPMQGVEVRLVADDGREAAVDQIGHAWVRTPDMMIGYWNDPLTTDRAVRNGWLDTGDLMRRDRDGYLWFVGRVKEIICRGGTKVAPSMVEAAIESHPAVERAAVVAIGDAVYGQLPFAFYETRSGAADPGEHAIQDWVRRRLDPASVPVKFVPLTSWPTTSGRKLDRARLAWMAEAGGVNL